MFTCGILFVIDRIDENEASFSLSNSFCFPYFRVTLLSLICHFTEVSDCMDMK